MAKINGYEFKAVKTSTYRGYLQTECNIYYNGKKIGGLDDDGRSYMNVYFSPNTASEDREQHDIAIRKYYLDIFALKDLENAYKKGVKAGNDCLVTFGEGFGDSHASIVYAIHKDLIPKVAKGKKTKFYKSLDDFVIEDKNLITVMERLMQNA